jgi:hypothetical protein
MKSLIKITIFIFVVTLISKTPQLVAPPSNSLDTATIREIKTGYNPAVALPKQNETKSTPHLTPQIAKSHQITDGVLAWQNLIAKYFPQEEVVNALKIASKENGAGDPGRTHRNRNGTVDYGLFQINSVHAAKVGGNLEKLKDPETNVKVAFQIWQEQGWRPWTTAKKLGLY